MPSLAHAVAIIVAGLLQPTLDQIAWSLSGILVLGACLLHVYSLNNICLHAIWVCLFLWFMAIS